MKAFNLTVTFRLLWIFVAALGFCSIGQFLTACQSAEPLPQETILRLKLNDSLKKYDSVVITLHDHRDMNRTLEKVWSGPLPAPSQIEGHILTAAKDKDFIVRIAGYASRDQLCLETLIYYEGGNKTVVHRQPPTYRPIYQLASMLPSAGNLHPPFHPDSLSYRDTLAVGIKTVSFKLLSLLTKAQISVNAIPLMAGLPSQELIIGTIPDTVLIQVMDATQGVEYNRQYRVILIPTLATPTPVPIPYTPVTALQSLISSVGSLTPVFNPDSLNYRITLAEGTKSVNFKAIPILAKAQVFVKGVAVPAGSASQEINLGNTPDTVLVKVVDATQGVEYNRQYRVILVPTLPAPKPVAAPPLLASIIPSAGTLSPAFKSDHRIYSLALPFASDSVDFIFHSNDTGNVKMVFNNAAILDNARSYSLKIEPGGSAGVNFQIKRDSLYTIYLITVTRPSQL